MWYFNRNTVAQTIARKLITIEFNCVNLVTQCSFVAIIETDIYLSFKSQPLAQIKNMFVIDLSEHEIVSVFADFIITTYKSTRVQCKE